MKKLIVIGFISIFCSCADENRMRFKGPREEAVIDLSKRYATRDYSLWVEDSSNTVIYRSYDELDKRRIDKNVYSMIDSTGEGAARIVDYKVRSGKASLDGIEYGVFIVSVSDEPENFQFHVVNLTQDKMLKKYDQ